MREISWTNRGMLFGSVWSLSMTKSETVPYTPLTRSFASTSVRIKKVKYQISNDNSSLNYDGSGSIYLMSVFSDVVNSSSGQ